MKLAINGALTIGTEDGANVEMRQAVTDRWWPFRFGASAEENTLSYKPLDTYTQDAAIRRAVDALKDGTFSSNLEETAHFGELHHSLLQNDPYRVLQDLRAYATTQQTVETLFLQPRLWAETVLHNIAAMGQFSADISIQNYAQKIWGLTPLPPDPAILAKVQAAYSENDRCRITI